MSPSLVRRLTAEAVGSALLLAMVVGSGIMGATLSGGNIAIALLANTLATATGLTVLILIFGPISGAHFNPVVSVAMTFGGGLRASDLPLYLLAQCVGAVAGVALAHAMFSQPLWALSQHARAGTAQALSEAVATFGLLATILGVSRHRPAAVPYAVGAFIASAYWFTASTSFANPAVTLARSLTDTFAGIRPLDVPLFIVAQGVGAGAAVFLFRWLLGGSEDSSPYPKRPVM